MREFFILFVHLLATMTRLMKPSDAKAIVAENLLMKQQLLVACRSRQRAPRLSALDRLLFGFWSLFLSTRFIVRAAILLKSSTLLLCFHAALVQRKYHRLFTPRTRKKPGPKGPSQELSHAIVEMKRRNPRFGCPRIAQQIAYIFCIEIDKDVIGRVLAQHYHPDPGADDGPSWLTVIGDTKDSLWSVDLFRCKSIRLQTHWVLVVMDQFTQRIIGFAFQAGTVNGVPSLSILDGWWLEGCIEGVTGWAVGDGAAARAQVEADFLYRKLEEAVPPLYYDERPRWLAVMKGAIAKNASFFDSHRMMRHYAADAYIH